MTGHSHTTKSSAYIKDELLLAMASILYDIAPPDGQKTIARLMDQLHAKQQEEEYQRFYGPHEEQTAERDWLEEGGFEAGLAGKRLEESATWRAAWDSGPGTNAPALVIAGWVAGRALRRIREELSNG